MKLKRIIWSVVLIFPLCLPIGNATGPISKPVDNSSTPGSEYNPPDFGPYKADLIRRIKRAWFPPRGQESRALSVRFTISRSGELSNLSIWKSAGIEMCDQAALAAVQNASPFRPLPANSPEVVDFEFEFDYKLFATGQSAVTVILPNQSSASSPAASPSQDLRGKRYGEVLLGRGGLLAPREMDVYNTIGLNDCPQELWSKLVPEKIKKETGVKAVLLNGPRYWTIDSLIGSSLVSKEQKLFGGIAMRHAGTLVLSIKDKVSFGKPYVIHKVARNTVWTFKSGLPVFQLVSPEQDVFFMQSFSVQKQNQSLGSLPDLASKLRLPKGWSFRTVILKNDYALKAIDGIAYVIQDDFDNTYQKSTAKPQDKL